MVTSLPRELPKQVSVLHQVLILDLYPISAPAGRVDKEVDPGLLKPLSQLIRARNLEFDEYVLPPRAERNEVTRDSVSSQTYVMLVVLKRDARLNLSNNPQEFVGELKRPLRRLVLPVTAVARLRALRLILL